MSGKQPEHAEAAAVHARIVEADETIGGICVFVFGPVALRRWHERVADGVSEVETCALGCLDRDYGKPDGPDFDCACRGCRRRLASGEIERAVYLTPDDELIDAGHVLPFCAACVAAGRMTRVAAATGRLLASSFGGEA